MIIAVLLSVLNKLRTLDAFLKGKAGAYLGNPSESCNIFSLVHLTIVITFSLIYFLEKLLSIIDASACIPLCQER